MIVSCLWNDKFGGLIKKKKRKGKRKGRRIKNKDIWIEKYLVNAKQQAGIFS